MSQGPGQEQPSPQPPGPQQAAQQPAAAPAQAASQQDNSQPSLGSLSDLAAERPSRLDRALQWIPRLLSSKPHVIALTILGVYLVLLPLLGVAVSAKAELIGGNYTNVTSDIGACIAAGGTLHLVRQGRKRREAEEERLRLMHEMRNLLHRAHPEIARELGQVADPSAGR